ncbi:hypothetical protein VP01_980g3 [Puccinia sorghi]|uniref:Uncharacterized protein n=1 Tax=Puccinia sorghi TaxID=27349 RepID=A0A0L6U5Q6_9BASI|nr:hypothetical protein VP01_980g3 [Puccinia sorghi]
MTEMDSTRILTPLSPTYMPYFPPHRSPLHSSSNTRQREDYEFSSEFCPSSPSPQVTVTLTDDEDCEGPVVKPDRLIDGYPAWELPFASEPALEGELEQGLPPLKKLKPDNDQLPAGSRLDKTSPDGIVLIGAVKGILTKRESPSAPHSPSPSSPICAEACFMPWSRTSGLGLATSKFSTPHPSSTPLSRRSSSAASSACAGSLKAVRFASGNGLPNTLGCLSPESSLTILPGQVEGPVAAIMYLTHSAEAYDRSPIIVENGLRLPPRAKPEDEDEYEYDEERPIDPPKSPLSPQKKRRTKLMMEPAKTSHGGLCASPEVLSPRVESVQETSVILKPPLSISLTYRDIEEVDEEEEDEETVAVEEAEDEADEGSTPKERQEQEDENSDDEDDEEGQQQQRSFRAIPASSCRPTEAQWGLGKWSSGEVFGSCDALGGF